MLFSSSCAVPHRRSNRWFRFRYSLEMLKKATKIGAGITASTPGCRGQPPLVDEPQDRRDIRRRRHVRVADYRRNVSVTKSPLSTWWRAKAAAIALKASISVPSASKITNRSRFWCMGEDVGGALAMPGRVFMSIMRSYLFKLMTKHTEILSSWACNSLHQLWSKAFKNYPNAW